MADSTPLKPCPFCGNKDIRLKHDNGVSFAYCYECFSRGTDFDNRDGVYRGGEAPFRAVEAWNKRA